MKKESLLVFTDASYHPVSRCGLSGYLFLPFSDETPNQAVISSLNVNSIYFQNTTSARLELTSILLAFDALINDGSNYAEIKLYTDCKTAFDFPSRRKRLEKCGFKSARSGNLLTNADLYLRFFERLDEIQPNIIWLKGHKPGKDKTYIDQIFSHVDRTLRKQLRAHGKPSPPQT